MEREIKFQFVIDGKYLSKPYTIEDLLNIGEERVLEDMEKCDCLLTESMPSCEGDCCRFENSKITGKRQFTGLKDKNGKEIYEGDIVSFQNRIHEVCINFNGYYLQRYKLWNGEFKKALCYSMSLITKPQNGDEFIGIVDQAEVIGNLYQTPELLKK